MMQKFNGSLIRQFPSLVTGNAAAGVGVTVFVSGTSTLASLFEDDGVTAKANPLTADAVGFYSFLAEDGKYRLQFSNGFPSIEVQALDAVQLRDDFDAIEASNAAFLVEQQAAYDAFVLSNGWDQVGTFTAGFTFTSPNQVGQDADGNWWRWNGAFNKIVTAGTLPSSDANYKLVGDGVLRNELAQENSSVVVSGETAAHVVDHLQFAVRIKPVIGETNAMPRIVAALTANAAIYIDGTLPITEVCSLTLVSKKVLGTRGHSQLVVSGLSTGIIFNLSNNAVVDGVSFAGDLGSAPVVTDGTTYAATVDEVIALKGAGGLSAVKLFSTSTQVNNCEFTRFSYFAALTDQNLNDAVDSNITNCRMYQNFGGIYQAERSEYMKFSGNSICYNVYGVYKRGGNNSYTGNNIDHNRVNFVTTEALNDSHGSVVGGTMNHGKLATFVANDIVNGEVVSGVNMFDCGPLGVYIRNSIGVNIQGGLLGQTNVFCEGRSTAQVGFPGVNVVSSNLFNLHGGTYKIYRNYNPTTGLSDPTTPDNCIFRDNYHMEGSRPRDGSTWDEQILNDDKAPDADGWMQQGTGNARWTSGKPLDGTVHLGNGATTGAIKVVLPSSVLDSTVLTFDISISTSDGKGGDYVFDVYAQADGSWLYYVPKSITGTFYKIRFGLESGKWVMYIGELATAFNGALFSINSVTVQRGNLQYSAIWKMGWLISRETTAFSSVTLSSPDANLVNKFVVYSGDLNTIVNNSDVYAYAGANLPAGGGGVCTTKIAAANTDIRWQSYHQEGTDKIFVRSTTTGGAGYSSWVEK